MMPFPGGVEATANGLVVFSVAAAILHGFMPDRPPSWRGSIAKVLGPFLLACVSFNQGGPVLLTAALLFVTLGHAVLAYGGNSALVGGLGAFLVGQIFYAALFAGAGEGISTLAGEPWRIAAAFALAVFWAGIAHRLWPAIGLDLRALVGAYVLALLAMGLAALTLDRPIVILGAMLFIPSGAFLATGKFLLPARSGHRPWMSVSAWSLFYLAQLQITLGILWGA
jgi:uncharacterized membrane protein YhhN